MQGRLVLAVVVGVGQILLAVGVGCSSTSTTNGAGMGDASTTHEASLGGGGDSPQGADVGQSGDVGSAPANDAEISDGGLDSGLGSSWTLVWSDEFNGPNGSAVDSKNWAAVINGNGNGNMELEYYTSDLANAQIQNGDLVITAMTAGANKYQCWYGPCQYTSARLQTKGLFSTTYGLIEASIKIAYGQGLWPAFWALGTNIDTVNWPACGEMDIMENLGMFASINYGSLHGTSPSGAYDLAGQYVLPNNVPLDAAFHTYAMNWAPAKVEFLVDGQIYETRTPADLPDGGTWAFDHPFFLLLNLAVGGSGPHDPDGSTPFPQSMLIDYVRVYSAVGVDY